MLGPVPCHDCRTPLTWDGKRWTEGGEPHRCPRRLCMTAADAAEWKRLNDLLPSSNRAPSPCADCDIRFAVEMRLERRCDGWPEPETGGSPWKRTAEERQQMARLRWRESKKRIRQRARAVA
jgi:hypothetical protein